MAQDAEVRYCWRCGKHVRREGGRCYYCGAVTHRTIRPARHCPFCDEPIGRNAVKCPHCKEFLTDEAREKARPEQAPHVTFVIDKAVIQGDQPLQLEGGSRLPSHVRNLLSQSTANAIERGDPSLLDQPGVRALPAPEEAIDAEIIDESEKPASRGALPAPQTGRHVVRRAGEEDRARAVERAERPAPGGSLVRAAAGKIMDFFDSLGEAEPREKEIDEAEFEDVDENADERYRDCPMCATEVLADDNYCFHCGHLLRKEAAGGPMRKPKSRAPVFGLILGGFLLSIGATVLDFLQFYAENPDRAGLFRFVGRILLALGCVFFLTAFLRRRTFGTLILVLVCLVVWAFLAGLRLLLTEIVPILG